MKNSSSLLIILAILILIIAGVFIYKYINMQKVIFPTATPNVGEEENQNVDDEVLVVKEKEVQIFKGTDRPIAVMIDNHSDAWPQANINKAYLVYEIVVEGGETRLMALYKGQELKKI